MAFKPIKHTFFLVQELLPRDCPQQVSKQIETETLSDKPIIIKKEGEKIKRYQGLKREIGRLWGIRHLEIVPLRAELMHSK